MRRIKAHALQAKGGAQIGMSIRKLPMATKKFAAINLLGLIAISGCYSNKPAISNNSFKNFGSIKESKEIIGTWVPMAKNSSRFASFSFKNADTLEYKQRVVICDSSVSFVSAIAECKDDANAPPYNCPCLAKIIEEKGRFVILRDSIAFFGESTKWNAKIAQSNDTILLIRNRNIKDAPDSAIMVRRRQ